MKTAARPLDPYPLINTQDVHAFQNCVSKLFVDSKFTLGSEHRRFRARMNYKHLQSSGLIYAGFSTPIVANFGAVNFFVQGIPLRGAGEQITNGTSSSVHRTKGGVMAPGASIALHFGAAFETLALKIDRQAVTGKLGALLDSPVGSSLEFSPETDFRTAAAQSLRRLVLFLSDEFSASVPTIPMPAAVELEQALIVWFLYANEHNYSERLKRRPRAPAPWQVRRAEEYIEANWDQPITVEALAGVTESSARSLFHLFRSSRGYSPMAFVKSIRLRKAQQLLADPDVKTTVTDVAFACGFGNLGHFSKDYYQTFGELPSETLNRSKGGRRTSPGGRTVTSRPRTFSRPPA